MSNQIGLYVFSLERAFLEAHFTHNLNAEK